MLTVEMYQLSSRVGYALGSDSRTWKARAMSPGEAVSFDNGYPLTADMAIRVTVSGGSVLVNGLLAQNVTLKR